MNRIVLGMLLTSALVASQTVSAVPINVTATRSVTVGDLDNGNTSGPNSPSSALGAFSDTITQSLGADPDAPEDTTADQGTDIQPGSGLFSGEGTGSVGFSVPLSEGVFANSFFDVFFEISLDHSFTLSGSLTASADGGSARARFDLLGPTPLSFSAIDSDTTPLADSGLLSAGSYHLTVSAIMDNDGNVDPGSFMGGTATYSFNFGITESSQQAQVPVPATLALLGLGLMGMVVARRRKPH